MTRISSQSFSLTRRRMLGALGFAYRSPGLLPRIADEFAQSIREYIQFRDVLQDADAFLLTEQAPAALPGWDVLEALNADSGDAVVFAYQQSDAEANVVVRPRGLRPDATYSVRSLDVGDLGTALGDDLIRDGIAIVQGDGSQAHILVLRRQ